MSQINLLSGNSGTGAERPRPKIWSGSLFLSLGILIVSFGLYFGVMFYKNILEREFASVKSEIAQKKNLVVGTKAERVADFFDRTTVIDSNLKFSALLPTDPLLRIERSMIPEVNLSSYKCDMEKKTINIGLVSDSFRALAQQIVTLKKEGGFLTVSIAEDAKIGTSGKVETSLSLAF